MPRVWRKPVPGVHPIRAQLRQLRVSANITQTRLGEELGYNKNQMSRIERGNRRACLEWIIDYASFFGYDITLTPRNPDET